MRTERKTYFKKKAYSVLSVSLCLFGHSFAAICCRIEHDVIFEHSLSSPHSHTKEKHLLGWRRKEVDYGIAAGNTCDKRGVAFPNIVHRLLRLATIEAQDEALWKKKCKASLGLLCHYIAVFFLKPDHSRQLPSPKLSLQVRKKV